MGQILLLVYNYIEARTLPKVPYQMTTLVYRLRNGFVRRTVDLALSENSSEIPINSTLDNVLRRSRPTRGCLGYSQKLFIRRLNNNMFGIPQMVAFLNSSLCWLPPFLHRLPAETSYCSKLLVD